MQRWMLELAHDAKDDSGFEQSLSDPKLQAFLEAYAEQVVMKCMTCCGAVAGAGEYAGNHKQFVVGALKCKEVIEWTLTEDTRKPLCT